MPRPANAKVIPFEKDPATMTDRELWGHIQYLKRVVAQWAEQFASVPPEALSKEERDAIEEVAASHCKHLALSLPIED